MMNCVQALKDLSAPQKILMQLSSFNQLAIDVAAGSGKSLEAVTNAMAKAAEGNTGALSKLGVGLTAAQLKTMSMDEVTAATCSNFRRTSCTASRHIRRQDGTSQSGIR
jgi:acyl-CoA hydrolase